jgi:hypothetical protein
MKTGEIKRLPKSLRFGGTRLHHGYSGETPQADGIRRLNNRCIELETFANLNHTGAAFVIGMTIVLMIAMVILLWLTAVKPWTIDNVIKASSTGVMGVIFATFFYFLGGTHRSRGAFIRVHRGTRKLYYVLPGKKHLHVLDWDQLEVLAGYVPIITGTLNTSRHPLYLIGVDYNLTPPREICIACGNLGVHDGDKSAKSLWAYLQHFMAHGPEGLPEPPPLPPRMTRKQATFRRFHEWKTSFRQSLTTRRGKQWAPVMIPLRLFWLIWDVFPECLAEFIQYNVPYTPFPKEIDKLCGFVEKRKPVIRVNGKIVDE